MKIMIEIDCTPEEARTFLGLPDVQPMQEAMMGELQRKMTGAMAYMDPEPLMKAWAPVGAQGLDALQRLMFGAAESALRNRKPEPADKA